MWNEFSKYVTTVNFNHSRGRHHRNHIGPVQAGSHPYYGINRFDQWPPGRFSLSRTVVLIKFIFNVIMCAHTCGIENCFEEAMGQYVVDEQVRLLHEVVCLQFFMLFYKRA